MLLSERMPFQAFQLPPTYDPASPVTNPSHMAFNQYPAYQQSYQQYPTQTSPNQYRQYQNYQQSPQRALPPQSPQPQQSYSGYVPPASPDPRTASQYPQQFNPGPPPPLQTRQVYPPPLSPSLSYSPIAATSQYVPTRQPQPVPASPTTSVITTLSKSDYSPYASPVSPSKSQFPRRPLPTPQAAGNASRRPATAPGQSSIPNTIQTTEDISQDPRNRPTSSSSIPERSLPPVAATSLTRHNTVSPPRPLPNPSGRSAQSMDLPRGASPPKSNVLETALNRHSSESDRPLAGQKFVPFWKRALPTPGTPNPEPQSPSVAERRGVFAPTPLQDTNKSAAARPLPTSPSGSTRTASLSSLEDTFQAPRSHGISDISAPNSAPMASPTSSGFLRYRDRSRTLPGPSGPAPTSALPSRPISVVRESDMSTSSSPEPTSSSDDDSLSNNPLLSRRQTPPSPSYGIRDLPSRSKDNILLAHAAGSSPTRASTLPPTPTAGSLPRTPATATPTSGLSRTPTAPQSSAFRIAASQSSSNPPGTSRRPTISGSPPKAYSFRAQPEAGPSQTGPSFREGHSFRAGQSQAGPSYAGPSKAGSSRWPTELPRLPNPPASPAFPNSPRSTSPTRVPPSPRVLPTRNQSLRNPVAATQQGPNGPPSLDDTPPRSLRRTPSPSPASPTKNGSPPRPNIRTKGVCSPTSPGGRSSPSTTPGSATSLFSLSQFPKPPTQVPVLPSNGVLPPRSPRINGGMAAAQANNSQAYQSQIQYPPQQLSNKRSPIPKISFPANADSESDEDEDGPMIVVSGSSNTNNGFSNAPKIAINGLDNDDNDLPQVPSISIGGVTDAPQISISVSGPSGSSSSRGSAPLPPLPAIRGKGGLVCGGCGGPIIGRIVSAMGARWHPGCFRCTVCNELLENLSSYEHEGRPYCHLDYHEKFAPRCYHCQTAIVDELFITLDDSELGKRTYHEQHFFCAECGDPFLPPGSSTSNRSFAGDGVFKADEDDVGFTVFRGHPYCETCHVRLRMPKCQRCKRSIRDGMQAVEALGGKWCWGCFTCASCDKPFDNPSFFLRDDKPFCEPCFSIMIKNEL